MKGTRKPIQHSSREPRTLVDIPFHELVENDPELKKLREQYATSSAEERHMAARTAHDSAHAAMLMAQAVNDPDWVHPAWHDAAAPLAIDPEYAPAMLAVGSLEYQYGRVEEAMTLFLRLTTLPADTEDLAEIIDRAGDFLIDAGDSTNAERLYTVAVSAYPQVALYHAGLGYCTGKSGRTEEAIAHSQRAVELEPDNCRQQNDLGFSLMEAGQYDEAQAVLERAVRLAPPDYDLPQGNLQRLRDLRAAEQ